jgi:hypothetical protein
MMPPSGYVLTIDYDFTKTKQLLEDGMNGLEIKCGIDLQHVSRLAGQDIFMACIDPMKELGHWAKTLSDFSHGLDKRIVLHGTPEQP